MKTVRISNKPKPVPPPKQTEEKETTRRKETIQERQRRVLGTTSLRYASDFKRGAPAAGNEQNKRRSQVLQAQRAHRERVLNYIDQLEAEIYRLRESANSSPVVEKSGVRPSRCAHPVYATQNININILVQSFKGQIAPGIFTNRVADAAQSNLDGDIYSMDMNMPWLCSTLAVDMIPRSLEQHDALTRMLFCNFSRNIAPTMVAVDSATNGYRSMLLPLAWENDLVRCALLAASANQLRFKRPRLTSLALNFQSQAVDKLVRLPVSHSDESTRGVVLATIVLLILTDMMSGGNEFRVLFNMAKSWIEAAEQQRRESQSSMSVGAADQQKGDPPTSDLNTFLLNQVEMLQIYAEPLLKERETIRSQHDQRKTFQLGGPSFSSRIRLIFGSLEAAIRDICSIYSYHVMHDMPPDNVEDLLDALKNTVEQIPPYSPGENALAWVYFIAAAETSLPTKRTFFSKKLMGIYERGSFVDTTTAFVMLHHIWECHEAGGSWTKALEQTPAVFALK